MNTALISDLQYCQPSFDRKTSTQTHLSFISSTCVCFFGVLLDPIMGALTFSRILFVSFILAFAFVLNDYYAYPQKHENQACRVLASNHLDSVTILCFSDFNYFELSCAFNNTIHAQCYHDFYRSFKNQSFLAQLVIAYIGSFSLIILLLYLKAICCSRVDTSENDDRSISGRHLDMSRANYNQVLYRSHRSCSDENIFITSLANLLPYQPLVGTSTDLPPYEPQVEISVKPPPYEPQAGTSADVPPYEPTVGTSAGSPPHEATVGTSADVPPYEPTVGTSAGSPPHEAAVGTSADVPPYEPTVGTSADVPPHEPTVGTSAGSPPHEAAVGTSADFPPNEPRVGTSADAPPY